VCVCLGRIVFFGGGGTGVFDASWADGWSHPKGMTWMSRSVGVQAAGQPTLRLPDPTNSLIDWEQEPHVAHVHLVLQKFPCCGESALMFVLCVLFACFMSACMTCLKHMLSSSHCGAGMSMDLASAGTHTATIRLPSGSTTTDFMTRLSDTETMARGRKRETTPAVCPCLVVCQLYSSCFYQ
jgi:hypothetical protein